MIDKSQPKCPSTIRGGCITPTPPPRWCLIQGGIGETEGVQALAAGLILPYWGVSPTFERPQFYWDGLEGYITWAAVVNKSDLPVPMWHCYIGLSIDGFPNRWEKETELLIGHPAWVDAWFPPFFVNFFGLPIDGELLGGLNAKWYKTYDLLRAEWPDAIDPAWKSL